MRDRALPTTSPARSSSRRSPFSIDVVLFTPRGEHLAALCVRAADPRALEHWLLPCDSATVDESLDAAARRIAKSACGVEPAWMEQVGAFGDGQRHPTESELSIAFVGVVPYTETNALPRESALFGVSEPPTLAARQRTMLNSALEALRSRMDYAPIAFRLLPERFTLSELQEMYELLLGKPLHKASFRRALQATTLVEGTDEWRSEGRGRPAQFFRFAPKKRRLSRRGVRFDLLA